MAILIALLLLLLPGLAFVRRAEWECGEPLELAGVAFASSAAYWAASFWVLERILLSWRFFAGLSIAGALLLLALRRRASISLSLSAWRRRPGRTLAQVGLLAGVLALRLAFAQTHVAYSGGDMTAHAALTEKIVLKDGFPRSQEPLLPIPRFGEIAPGFHALSALVSLLSGASSHRVTIYILCLSVVGITAAFQPAPAWRGDGRPSSSTRTRGWSWSTRAALRACIGFERGSRVRSGSYDELSVIRSVISLKLRTEN